ncbi:ComEA family DNA-binding protein ['Paenibacillus yunnanensis' Narsing Rao et al. 2020]|uniref:ComEA family DNA-binding protein n=1 Tax=Paenibacillus tengchongensis TaxID=2608684 RepID=UPI00124C75DB|nr:ComEA family DNA-binding protein [Paenibacillus tengchongensis]
MNKGAIFTGVVALLLGGGLVWAGDHSREGGIDGWETMNEAMAQAVGAAGDDTAAAGSNSGNGGNNGADSTGPGEGAKSGEAAGKGTVQSSTTGTSAVPAGSGAEAGEGAPGTAGLPAEVATDHPGIATAEDQSGQTAAADGKINVNTAGVAELMDLPGIGEKKAQAIIDYRNQNGHFRSLSDLGEVKGIGDKMLEKLKDSVMF